MRTVMASDFKQRCLALLDLVEETGETVVVTKRGRPVARVVPVEPVDGRSTFGSVKILAEDESDLFSTGERWDAAD